MTKSSWTVKGCFYTSLVLALGSIHTATQQAVALSRIGSGPDKAKEICRLFVKELEQNQLPDPALKRFEVGAWQLYVWQIPISMLSTSVYVFVAGLTVLVWDGGHYVGLLFAQGETKVGHLSIVFIYLHLTYVRLITIRSLYHLWSPWHLLCLVSRHQVLAFMAGWGS